MATNYTFAQVCKIINDGNDTEALIDIGKKFPLTLRAVSLVTAVAGDNFVDLMGFMPEYVTAKKFEAAIRSGAPAEANDSDDENDEDTTATENEDAPAAKPGKKAKKAEKNNDEDATGGEAKGYDSMSGKELWDILGKAGKRKDCKEKMGGCKKEQMVEYINKYGLGDAAAEEPEEDAEEEATEEAKENPYDGKSAMELFKECKKRGLKVAPKKPAKFYADQLLADDAAKDEGDAAEDSDDDWETDEAEEEAPKAKAGKKAPAEKNKPAKKAAKEEDEDDNWDI